jgi:hypothetical protein
MREFIKSIFNEENKISFSYENYDTLFVKEKYNMFYLFFFVMDEEELLKLKKESGKLYKKIKSSKDIYEIDMDKNVTCIYCLGVDKKEYYDTEKTGTISNLSKNICLVEEDLNFFKKNVLLYTDDMDKFASDNVGKFDRLCEEIITESNFQNYKKSNYKNYQYDFLINLFIKLPFLNFQKYQLNKNEEYKSVSSFIDEKCNDATIDKENIAENMKLLEEKISDEKKLYEWLDELIENEKNNSVSEEVKKDEG